MMVNSKLMVRAQKENWPIFLLKGFQAQLKLLKPIIGTGNAGNLRMAIAEAIESIKTSQRKRS